MLRVESRMSDILGTRGNNGGNNIGSSSGNVGSSSISSGGEGNIFHTDWMVSTQKSSLRKKSQSFDSVDNANSVSSNDPWGWFDEIESNVLTPNGQHYTGRDDNNNGNGNHRSSQPGKFKAYKTLSLPLPASNPPSYVLESSVETQQLWYETAGQRPQQPRHEREYFENLWKRNFENSSVSYKGFDLPNISEEDENLRVDVMDGKIVQRGRGPFSIAVSKSFQNYSISCVTLQMPSFRVIASNNGSFYAEFLVVVTFSNIQSLSLGIWRRHSHFADLVHQINAMADGQTTYRNTLLSWQCLLNRKRWYKCLDQEYLSLKCFLLERFMHDLLFESPTPVIISEFLGLEE